MVPDVGGVMPSFECKICKKSFVSKAGLARHKTVHRKKEIVTPKPDKVIIIP